MIKQMIKIGKKHSIRGMDIDFVNGRIFLADYEKGDFFHYSIEKPIQSDSKIEQVCCHVGSTGARVVKYWEERDEVFVGFTGGKICVYQIDSITSGPICKPLFRACFNVFRLEHVPWS